MTLLKHGRKFYLLLLIFFSFVLGSFFGASIPTLRAYSDKLYQKLDLFTQILYYVENDYVDPINDKTLMEGAIKGMLSTLDPHTTYLSPEAFKELKVDTSGRFAGVGIEISQKEGMLVVVTAIEDSPAARAGIESGDRIIRINGALTKGLTLNESVEKMRGAKNTKVSLSIYREGWKDTKDFSLKREEIKVKSVKADLLEPGFAYAKISSFQARVAQDLQKSLQNIEKTSGALKGLVLDLRNNPGGLLDEAVALTSLFVSDGVVVSTKGRKGDITERKVLGLASYPNLPLVILVNGGSASASEIVAGAIQDYGRGHIIGTSNTFGKGSVQTVLDLGDHSGLKLTIARYYTPKGRQIDGKGITPDTVLKPEENKTSEDNLKKAALLKLKKNL